MCRISPNQCRLESMGDVLSRVIKSIFANLLLTRFAADSKVNARAKIRMNAGVSGHAEGALDDVGNVARKRRGGFDSLQRCFCLGAAAGLERAPGAESGCKP